MIIIFSDDYNKEQRYCSVCYERHIQFKVLRVDSRGIVLGWLCPVCDERVYTDGFDAKKFAKQVAEYLVALMDVGDVE